MAPWGAGNPSLETVTAATIVAECASTDRSEFTASLAAAVFYTVDAQVCAGSGQSVTRNSTQGQVELELIVDCWTDLARDGMAEFISPQIGHAIVTAPGAYRDAPFPIA